MTMHLAHPALTLGGKKKGKQKFRNADEARKARELAAEWEALKVKYKVPAKEKRVGKIFEPYRNAPAPHIRDTGPRPPSLNPADMRPAPRAEAKVYTGTKMLGIGTMHKSNSVPIFSDEEAVAIATMRRN